MADKGVKAFLRGVKPPFANCRNDGFGPAANGKLEVDDRGRFFTVTGHRLNNSPSDVQDCQESLDGLCNWLWPQSSTQANELPESQDTTLDACLATLLRFKITDHSDGSHRLYVACCRCVEHDLSDGAAISCIRQYAAIRPFLKEWTDAEISTRLRDAEKHCTRGEAVGGQTLTQKRSADSRFSPQIKRVGELLDQFTET